MGFALFFAYTDILRQLKKSTWFNWCGSCGPILGGVVTRRPSSLISLVIAPLVPPRSLPRRACVAIWSVKQWSYWGDRIQLFSLTLTLISTASYRLSWILMGIIWRAILAWSVMIQKCLLQYVQSIPLFLCLFPFSFHLFLLNFLPILYCFSFSSCYLLQNAT